MTENCNLRCKYCGYHDTRYKNNIPLKDIDEMTLKKSLDFIVDHSKDAYETTISFYGGEPIICFNLIKFAIEYIGEKNFKGHKYNYRITTNGTLLYLNVIDYFVTKDIKCVISLDGPVFLHDRYRVYEGNTPTYFDVIKNLKNIAKKYPEYYNKNILFQAVVAPPYARPIPTDYFRKSEVLFMDVTIGDFFKNVLKNEHNSELHDVKFLEKSEIIPLRLGIMKKDELMKNMGYIGSLKKYMHIGEKNIRNSIFPSGFCIPLLKRIYIGADGKIALCERVDEKNQLFQMGDVDSGYDFEKINILYKYTNNKLIDNCNKCWAFRFCHACFASLEEIEYNGEFCKYIRQKIEHDLINYIDFKNNNKRFHEIMQSISVE